MKTLLVRLSSMGDLIHTLPAVDDLSRMRPDVNLHWLCEAGFADIARLHPFVRQVHEMRWRQWRKDLLSPATWRQIGRLKQDLQQQHFDDVLDSQGLVKSALFAKIAHAPVKGLDGSSARERWAALAYHHSYAVPKGENAVWRNRMLFAQAFGYALPDEQHFGLVVPESARLPDLPAHYYVALHAFSATVPRKRGTGLCCKSCMITAACRCICRGAMRLKKRALKRLRPVCRLRGCALN